jgi:hypothetical protein
MKVQSNKYVPLRIDDIKNAKYHFFLEIKIIFHTKQHSFNKQQPVREPKREKNKR